MQNPHCSAWCSLNARCSAVSSPSGAARPSTVSSDDRGLHREHQARAHRLAVELHGARAADAVLAADVGAGQPEPGGG